MILSVSTWSAHTQLLSGELSKEDFVKFISEHGAKGMEVVDFDFADNSYESMKELQDIGRKYGVEITCMSLEHDLCEYFENKRQEDVDKVIRWLEISKKLNVKNVRVFTGWLKEGIPYYIQKQWVHEGMKKIVKKAEELDLNLVLENHNNVCLGADEILELIKAMNTEKLFTCPDVFNYKTYSVPKTPLLEEWSYEEIEKILPMAKNAHIKITKAVNSNTEDPYVDIPRMLELLKKYNYDGPVALEFMWPLLDESEDKTEKMGQAIEVLKYQLKDYMN